MTEEQEKLVEKCKTICYDIIKLVKKKALLRPIWGEKKEDLS